MFLVNRKQFILIKTINKKFDNKFDFKFKLTQKNLLFKKSNYEEQLL